MKKSDVIKQKNKLKATNNFRFVRYARAMCIVVPLVFLLYTLASTGFRADTLETMLIEHPEIMAGFVVCFANFLMWYVLGNILSDMKSFKRMEHARFLIFIMGIGELMLFNYISAGLLLLSLKSYFHWHQFSLATMFKDMKKDHSLRSALGITSGLVFLILLEILFVFLTQAN